MTKKVNSQTFISEELNPKEFSDQEKGDIKGRALRRLIDNAGWDVVSAWYVTILADLNNRGYEIKLKGYKNE